MRLQPLLDNLISGNQFAFIKGRNIHECSFIASEIIHSIRSRRQACMVLKLDFHKDFDRISWKFIDSVLKKMGLNDKWISWLSNCQNNSTTSILINGSPCAPIRLQKGVKQGDPLSPFIFVLAVEGLKQIIDTSIRNGLLTGFQLENSLQIISLLEFADDTMCFLLANASVIPTFVRILRFFKLISGLQINYHGSYILGINIADSLLHSCATTLGYKIEKFLINYLGAPRYTKQLMGE